jgi:hypothetical protein
MLDILVFAYGVALSRANFFVPSGEGNVYFTSLADGKLTVNPALGSAISVSHGPSSVAEVSTTKPTP